MKKSLRKERTVTELLAVKNKSLIDRIRYRNLPRHTFIYCRSRNIAERFLADAEAEGFTFGDGKKPAEKEYDDIFSLHDDLTISYTGWAGHVLFRNAVGNLIRIVLRELRIIKCPAHAGGKTDRRVLVEY